MSRLSVRLVIAVVAIAALVAVAAPSSVTTPVADLVGSVGAPGNDPSGTPPTTPSSTPSSTPSTTRSASTSPTPSPPPSEGPAESRSPHRRTTPPAPRTTPTPAERVLRRMTLPQRVGQVFMVGTPATGASQVALGQISRLHVGNVMLTGRAYTGTRAVARVSAAVRARATRPATARVLPLVATDQEGGEVQVLHGRGLAEMPSALDQGRWAPARLQRSASTWARQLRAAGVNMNLAPVADTVPGPAAAADNPPIGAHDREFGYTPAVVGRHAVAFARGMAGRGVVPVVKHFPGLGRVHANTDVWQHVTDRTTRRHDPYLAPFREAVDAGVPAVMMSTAYYTRLDRHHPAAFSPFVVRTVLRGDLGFDGVVVSDDLGSARQVSAWSAGERAVRFLRAGGDLVLTVDPGTVPAMYAAVLGRARHDPAFRDRVERSALRVLTVKQRQHLLGRRG